MQYKRAIRDFEATLEALETRQLLSTATDQLAANISATDTTHTGQVLVNVTTLPSGTQWWNQDQVWLDDPANPDDWSLSAIYVWEAAPATTVVVSPTSTEVANLISPAPGTAATLTETQQTALAVTPLDVVPGTDPNPPVATTLASQTLLAQAESVPDSSLPSMTLPIPDNTPAPTAAEAITTATPLPYPDAVLPYAEPTVQPVALPAPTDCPTMLPSTDPVSGDSLPAPTASNPLVETAAVVAQPIEQQQPLDPATDPEPDPSNFPSTDPGPIPDLGPEVPAMTYPLPPIAPEYPDGIAPTTTSTSTLYDAAITSLVETAAMSALNTTVAPAVPGVLAGVIVTSGLTGCTGTMPQVVDPDGVPVPAPSSTTTVPPDATTVPPDASVPVPTTSTTTADQYTVAIAVPPPSPYYYYGDTGHDAEWPA